MEECKPVGFRLAGGVLDAPFADIKKDGMKTLRFGLVLLTMTAVAGVIPVRADQPEMHAALADLRSAKMHLEHAMRNKGGERVEAIEHVNRAIRAVERGMEHAR